MRYVAILAVLLATVATASDADTDKLSPREAGRFVRVLYLAPADRDFRADFESSIATAVASVHRWYREQLDGSTFAVYRPMAERCRLPEDSDYYSRGDVWEKVLRDVQSCAPVRGIGASGGDINAAQVVWVLYVDATERLNCDEPQELGRGGLGLTMLPREDLELMVQPGLWNTATGPSTGACRASTGDWRTNSATSRTAAPARLRRRVAILRHSGAHVERLR